MSLTSSFLNLAIVLGLPHVIKQRFTQTSLLLGASAIQMGLWMATPSSIRTKSVKRTGSANKTTKITLKLADIVG